MPLRILRIERYPDRFVRTHSIDRGRCIAPAGGICRIVFADGAHRDIQPGRRALRIVQALHRRRNVSLQQRLFKVLHFSEWAVDRTTLTWTYLVKYDGERPTRTCRIPSDFAELTDVARRQLETLLDANAPAEKLLEVFGVQ